MFGSRRVARPTRPARRPSPASAEAEQEGDRAESVRRPHAHVRLLGVEPVLHRQERADVEEHECRPVGSPTRASRSASAPMTPARRGGGCDRRARAWTLTTSPVLHVRRPTVKRSEPMKKTTPIAGRDVDAHCVATEATRKQMEPSAKSVDHPQTVTAERVRCLAMCTRAPLRERAVRPAQRLARDERPRTVGRDPFPAFRKFDVAAPRHGYPAAAGIGVSRAVTTCATTTATITSGMAASPSAPAAAWPAAPPSAGASASTVHIAPIPIAAAGTNSSPGRCEAAIPAAAPTNIAGNTGPPRKLESDSE